MLRSSIDIGSNSVLLLIAQVRDHQLESVLTDKCIVTGLGKDLDLNKKFIEESMVSTFEVLSHYKELIEGNGLDVSKTIVTATEASRVASNAKDFFKEVKDQLGFKVQVISSEGEAYYTGKGISLSEKKSKSSREDQVIVDLGGASTEIIKIKTHPFQIIKSISLPMGSVRGRNWMNDQVFSEKLEEIFDKNDLSDFKRMEATFVAGTMTSLAGMIFSLNKFDDEKIHGKSISKNEFKLFIDAMADKNQEKILKDYPFLKSRAATVASGGLIILALIEILGVEELAISTMGLRHGTLMEGAINGKYCN